MKKLLIVFFCLLLFLFGLILVLGGGFGSKTNYPVLNNGKPIVFAHRGGVKSLLVENSIEAFNRGIDLGFNGIETDLRLTKDKRLVLLHDESCLRLLGIDKDIQDLNWSEIKSSKLIHAGKKTTNNVLLFDEFLRLTPDSIIIYLDIKVSSFELADLLLKQLKALDKSKSIIIGDEDIVFLSYLKYKNPKVKAVLEGFNKGKEWLHYIIPKWFKPDFYSSHISQVGSNHVAFLKENDLLNNRIVYGVELVNLSSVFEFEIPHVIYDYDSSGIQITELEKRLTLKKY